jgi:hypothetical protein
MSEYKLHVAIIKHIESAFPGLLYFHVPNQTRDATEAFFNKQMGVRPGIPDIILAWRGGQGMMEIKTEAGKISSNQNKTMSAFHAIGWHTGVVRNVKSAHQMLVAWGIKPVHNAIKEPDLRSDDQKKSDSFNAQRPIGSNIKSPWDKK